MLVTILKVRKCHRKSYVKWKPARIFLSKQLRNCNLVIQQPSKILVSKFKMADNRMFMVFSKKCLWFSLGGGQLIFSIRWVSKTLCWQIFSVVFEVLVKLAVRLILTLTKMTKYPWQFLKSSVHLGGNIDQQRELISREKFSNPSTQNDEISYDPTLLLKKEKAIQFPVQSV